MAIGNVYWLKTWIQREGDNLALSRWALEAAKFMGGQDINLLKPSPSDEAGPQTFAALVEEAERIIGKSFEETARKETNKV